MQLRLDGKDLNALVLEPGRIVARLDRNGIGPVSYTHLTYAPAALPRLHESPRPPPEQSPLRDPFPSEGAGQAV